MSLALFRVLTALLAVSLAGTLKATTPDELVDGFHIELSNPEYSAEGMVTSIGGVVWSDQFRLQARSIKHFFKDGHSWIEADGDLMLFYQGRLLVGDQLLYNLSERSGVLKNASLGIGGWYASAKKAKLMSDHAIRLEKAALSTDPSSDSLWNIQATSILIRPKQTIEFKNLTFRLKTLPLLYVPLWNNSEDTFFDQPLEYEVVWKGSRKRKASVRYRFYNSPYAQLWSRLEYHVGRGPGVGLDGKIQVDGGEFDTTNLVAKDSSISDKDLKNRYRFKGHYHRSLSPTATFDLYYDKFSDPDTPKDYAFTPFDLREAGNTRVTLRDSQEAFIHQISERIKFNSFQTVKRELPSYYLTPHPLYAPRTPSVFDSLIITSHWRAEYLAYDFQDRNANNNYHSSRLLSSLQVSRPFSLSGFQLTPSVGWQVAGYNNTPDHSSAGILAPMANFHGQTQWYSEANEHLVVAYSTLKVVGDPKSNIDDHYVFDSRDAICRSTRLIHGVRQEWYTQGRQKALLQLQSTHMMNAMAQDQPPSYYTFEGQWLASARWLLASEWNFSSGSKAPCAFSVRTENSWSPTLASVLEYRQRNATFWKKSTPDNFGLESSRSREALIGSALSDPNKTILTHINYRLTPNWVLRLDTAHGWDRGYTKLGSKGRVPGYQQYSLGVGTDLGANWRLQFQVEYTVHHDLACHMRLDLRDGPVLAPAPRF